MITGVALDRRRLLKLTAAAVTAVLAATLLVSPAAATPPGIPLQPRPRLSSTP